MFPLGPYYCAKDTLLNSVTACGFLPALMDVSELIDFTHTTAKSGAIDPVTDMQGDKVLIIRGKYDSLVKQGQYHST
jgi:hypothetical protein